MTTIYTRRGATLRLSHGAPVEINAYQQAQGFAEWPLSVLTRPQLIGRVYNRVIELFGLRPDTIDARSRQMTYILLVDYMEDDLIFHRKWDISANVNCTGTRARKAHLANMENIDYRHVFEAVQAYITQGLGA